MGYEYCPRTPTAQLLQDVMGPCCDQKILDTLNCYQLLTMTMDESGHDGNSDKY